MLLNLMNMYKDNLEKFNCINYIIDREGLSLYGSGDFSKWCIKYLIDNGIKINYIIDRDLKKHGTKNYGIPVIHNKSNILSKSSVILVSTTRFVDEIIDTNKEFYDYIVSFHQWFIMKYFFDFLDLRNYFCDSLSLNTFDSILFYRYNSSFKDMKNIFVRDHYFINEVFPSAKNEIFLDAGAYVGDTLEQFIINSEGIFEKIYAFEPGEKQFNSMKLRVNRLINEWGLDKDRIVLEQLGISDDNKVVFFDTHSDILSNSISDIDSDSKIDVVSIDNYLNGRPITFLKADIEGEELSMLKGAKKTIVNYKPKMAISIYHNPDDFITIMTYIKSIVSEYKFYLRHHSPTFAETVLYCIVE